MELSHVNKMGEATMVDVSRKPVVKRTAVASGKIRLKKETVALVQKGMVEKGDVLACARTAGILGGKRVSELIPLCHNIPIDQITVDFQYGCESIEITAQALCTAKTGIEMEALAAVSLAALTVYDMCKAVDKEMVISDIKLMSKKKEALP